MISHVSTHSATGLPSLSEPDLRSLQQQMDKIFITYDTSQDLTRLSIVSKDRELVVFFGMNDLKARNMTNLPDLSAAFTSLWQ